MKASEFRIGNWILPKMKEYKSEWKAVSLGPDILIEPVPIQVFSRLITRMVFNEDTLKMYEPIPLTEEWLLKFGCQRTRQGWFISANYSLYNPLTEFNTPSSKYYGLMFNDKYITTRAVVYVHQLQNLYFTLTGEELTIGGNNE